jgi:hypothetical protein
MERGEWVWLMEVPPWFGGLRPVEIGGASPRLRAATRQAAQSASAAVARSQSAARASACRRSVSRPTRSVAAHYTAAAASVIDWKP